MQVIDADIDAGTNIIHVVDTVLLPCELRRGPPKRTGTPNPDDEDFVDKCSWNESQWRWMCENVTVDGN